jgi:hypothetical protein
VKTDQLFSRLFRRYPVFRDLTWFAVVLAVLSISALIGLHARKVPVISSINPPVGSPGDIMVLSGQNFGVTRSSSYVEVGGSRLTASGYLSWKNDVIKVVLPSNVQDGLVIVGTAAGRSKPFFFANEAAIPIAVPSDTHTSLPVIASISPEIGSYGSLVVISGSNFGTIRNNSAVFFAANRDDSGSVSGSLVTGQQANVPGNMNTDVIAANESNFDYEYWSNTELHVRIPDGAASGSLYVQTEKGTSNSVTLEAASSVGTRSYTGRRTYLLQIAADVANAGSKGDTLLTMRIPRPAVSSQQPMAELTDCSPEPVIRDYAHSVIYQTEPSKLGSKKIRFNQDFVIAVYQIQTTVDPRYIKPFSEKTRVLYTAQTAPDRLIKSSDPSITALCKTITGKEINPYKQALLIYNYMLDNYKLEQQTRKSGDNPYTLMETRKGDAYDWAVVFTALVRSASIPCIPVSGVLIDSELKTKNHWWSEFYIENFGWIPVDPALAAGLNYKPFRPVDDPRTFYFGSLDSQHIAFSRGFNEIKQSSTHSKYIYRARAYALQSIWEEATGTNINYSSLWNNPVVIGVY